jgi:hypothetical protein
MRNEPVFEFSLTGIGVNVKSNAFNGVNLPDIYIWKKGGKVRKVKGCGYEDFKERLG